MEKRWVISLYRMLPRSLTSRIVRMMKPTFPIGVVAVVFDAQHRVLLLKHTYHHPAWRLPGGLMEKHETPEQTAVRETMEEANCKIAPIAIVDACRLRFSFDVAVSAKLVDMGKFQASTEVSECLWVHPEDLPQMPESQVRFISRALHNLKHEHVE